MSGENSHEPPGAAAMSPIPDLATRFSIFQELSGVEEEERRSALRPHDDVDLGTGDADIKRLRERLDDALDALTQLEIGCELGLYDLTSLGVDPKKILEPELIKSDAFLRYLGAYLYFGVRIFAGRIAHPPWWDPEYPGRRPEVTYPFVNKRSLQLAVPPGVAEGTLIDPDVVRPHVVDQNYKEAALHSFLTLRPDPDEAAALLFLDGFHPDETNEQTFDVDEPAEFDLWLRGLRPGLSSERTARFTRIRDGLIKWSGRHAAFYISLEPESTQRSWNASKPLNRHRPKDGWVITNAVSSRIALADFYWIARLLRAEVSASGQVSYPRTSWLHSLRFQSVLQDHGDITASLRAEEEVLRSAFDFVSDLVLNSVEVSDLLECRTFEPDNYPDALSDPRCKIKPWRAVFDAELRELELQKNTREYSLPRSEPPAVPNRQTGKSEQWSKRLSTLRDTRHRVGLAFSGGGIRSATFNLGVLQGLQELDLLRHVDYVSTVSGGGFIGSWLVGNVRRSQHWLGRLTCWDESIEHLRSYSNYLAPLTGILSVDTWTLGVSWVRNAFLVQLTGLAWVFALLSAVLLALQAFLYGSNHLLCAVPNVLCSPGFFANVRWPGYLVPMVAAAGVACLTVILSLQRSFAKGRADTGKNAPSSLSILKFTVVPAWFGSFLLACIFWSSYLDAPATPPSTFYDYSKILHREGHFMMVLFAVHLLAVFLVGSPALASAADPASAPLPTAQSRLHRIQRAFALICAALACTAVLYLELCGVLYLFLKLHRQSLPLGPVAFVFGPSLVLVCFTVSVVVWIGLSSGVTSDNQREWWTRYGAWLTMFSAAATALASLTVFGPLLVIYLFGPGHGNIFNTIKWTSVLSWIGTVIGGLLAGNSSKTGDRQTRQSIPLDLLAKAGGFLFILTFFIVAATALYSYITVWGTLKWSDYWHVLELNQSLHVAYALVATAICGIIFSYYFDINLFSLSRFYQYRLVRCYLGATRWRPGVRRPHPFTGFDPKDDFLLSELNSPSYVGPYPLVNCTLNLAGSPDLALNTRHSASFCLTPLYCGSDRPKIGYVPTGSPRSRDTFAGGVKLGQAAAISGAAASPNMGYNTSPLVAFLLTMFNVRLGWWFPNPGRLKWNSKGLRSSLYYLTRELLGIADEKRNFLNISDGGHFENLAIYELIRRRCTVIIAGDAECDQLLQFGGLGNVLRICGTDFGAHIEIDVKSIREQKEGRSLAHAAIGMIKYDNGAIGYLIYLKASVTGDEDPSILQYRAAHPTFPHESTANQFFTEDQFESYRKLGMHVVQHSFRGTHLGQEPLEAAEQMYDTLAPSGCSSAAFLKHTQTLQRLYTEFRVSSGVDLFLRELMFVPGHDPVKPEPNDPPSLTREEFCIALELIQLMEEVFLDLQLDDFWEHPDNRGWAILFMRWARSPRFQLAWKEARRTHGIRFEYFCAARLGLEPDQPILRIK
jgi:hypothetical protein